MGNADGRGVGAYVGYWVGMIPILMVVYENVEYHGVDRRGAWTEKCREVAASAEKKAGKGKGKGKGKGAGKKGRD